MKKARGKIVLRPETETTWEGIITLGSLYLLALALLAFVANIMLVGGQILTDLGIM